MLKQMNHDAQATRPIQPRPQLQTLGERQSNPLGFADRATARVNPVKVQIQNSRGQGWIGNLDDIVERERQRYMGGTPQPAPAVAPVLPQQPGLPAATINATINNTTNNRATMTNPATENCGRGLL